MRAKSRNVTDSVDSSQNRSKTSFGRFGSRESVKSPKIAIVGSRVSRFDAGAAAAKAGAKVTVFESCAEIGGLASAWQIGDVVWDKHYHVTLLSDTYTRKIVEEIGLGENFEWVETKTGFYTDGKLVSMSNTMEFLRFPPLGIIAKLRLGGTIFLASRIKDWKKLEKILGRKMADAPLGKKDL